MKSFSAKEAKYNFGRMIDLARAEPVIIERHGRPVVVVLSVEEWEKLHRRRSKQERSNGGSRNEQAS
jgi:prevent-host-death family protein